MTLYIVLNLGWRLTSSLRLSLILLLITNALLGPSASEVTTLWGYTNMFITALDVKRKKCRYGLRIEAPKKVGFGEEVSPSPPGRGLGRGLCPPRKFLNFNVKMAYFRVPVYLRYSEALTSKICFTTWSCKSDVSSPSGVWGGAPAENDFDAFWGR